MGWWFARFLLKEGMEVILTDRDPDKLRKNSRRTGVVVKNDSDIKQADVVLFAVPIDSFEAAAADLAPHVRPGQIVVDITSVKVMPLAVMHKYFERNLILGTHPMFGPGVRSISNRNFILTPTSEAEANLAKKVKAYLISRRANVTIMTPEEHDEMMSVILALPHFIALAAAEMLADLKDPNKLASISGSSYKKLVNLIDSVLSQDPGLYSAIQMLLAGVPALEKRFLAKAGVWAEIVKNGDKEKFIKRMQGLKEHFGQI